MPQTVILTIFMSLTISLPAFAGKRPRCSAVFSYQLNPVLVEAAMANVQKNPMTPLAIVQAAKNPDLSTHSQYKLWLQTLHAIALYNNSHLMRSFLQQYKKSSSILHKVIKGAYEKRAVNQAAQLEGWHRVEQLMVSIALLRLLVEAPKQLAKDQDGLIVAFYELIDPSPTLADFGLRLRGPAQHLAPDPTSIYYWALQPEIASPANFYIHRLIRLRQQILNKESLEGFRKILRRNESLREEVSDIILTILQISVEDGTITSRHGAISSALALKKKLRL